METVNTENIDKQALEKVEYANQVVITDNPSYEVAAEFLKGVKAIRREIDGTFDPISKKQHSAWKETLAQKKRHSVPLDNAEKIVKGKINEYVVKCNRIRQEEEARIAAELKKQQEEEAAKRAADLEAAGETEEAEAVVQEAIETTPTVVLPKIESKVAGISTRKVWRWKLIDPTKINRQYLKVDEVKINKQVSALGADAEGMVGGIRVYRETQVAARG